MIISCRYGIKIVKTIDGKSSFIQPLRLVLCGTAAVAAARRHHTCAAAAVV